MQEEKSFFKLLADVLNSSISSAIAIAVAVYFAGSVGAISWFILPAEVEASLAYESVTQASGTGHVLGESTPASTVKTLANLRGAITIKAGSASTAVPLNGAVVVAGNLQTRSQQTYYNGINSDGLFYMQGVKYYDDKLTVHAFFSDPFGSYAGVKLVTVAAGSTAIDIGTIELARISPGAPVIGAASILASDTTTSVSTTINTQFKATGFYLEYWPDSQPSNKKVTDPRFLEGAAVADSVQLLLAELSRSTLYRYQIFAYNFVGFTSSPVGMFTTSATPTSADSTLPQVNLLTVFPAPVSGDNVVLTASATDASGIRGVFFIVSGSGGEVTFPGTQQTGTSTYIAPWYTTRYPNGTYQISAHAYDFAGNKGTSISVPALVQNPVSGGGTTTTETCPVPQQGQTPLNQFTGCYYDNKDFTNYKFNRVENIDFNWGYNSPSTGTNFDISPTTRIGFDTFSVAWVGNFNFATNGLYKFTARADDGIRAWVDGEPLLLKRASDGNANSFIDQSESEYTGARDLAAGSHYIKVEFYENGGLAVAKFNWDKVAGTTASTGGTLTADTCVLPAVGTIVAGGFTGCYYDNVDFTSYKFTRLESINFNWGYNSPSTGTDFDISPNTRIGFDTFSARWAGNFSFPSSGSYKFTARTDDGIRAWVDGEPLLLKRTGDGYTSSYTDQGETEYTGTRDLAAGSHYIKVEFYENGGLAVAKFNWDLVPAAVAEKPKINTPSAGAVVNGNQVSVTASAGNLSVQSMQLHIDNQFVAPMSVIGPANFYLANFDSTKFANGSHTLKVGAVLREVTPSATTNLVFSDPVTITINNSATAPVVKLARFTGTVVDTNGGPANATVSALGKTVQTNLQTGIYFLEVTLPDSSINPALPTLAMVNVTASLNGSNISKSELKTVEVNSTNQLDFNFKVSSACTNVVGKFCTSYYNDTQYTGTGENINLHYKNLVRSGDENYPISYNWGTGGPGSGVNPEYFSTTWEGMFTFEASEYEFVTTNDDGMRLQVDGVDLINKYFDTGAITTSAKKVMTAGNHKVRVDYYEHTGDARAQVNWSKVGTTATPSASASKNVAIVPAASIPVNQPSLVLPFQITASSANDFKFIGLQFEVIKTSGCVGALSCPVNSTDFSDFSVTTPDLSVQQTNIASSLYNSKFAVSFNGQLVTIPKGTTARFALSFKPGANLANGSSYKVTLVDVTDASGPVLNLGNVSNLFSLVNTSTPAVNNHLPYGFFDGIYEDGVIKGWVRDDDNTSKKLKVRVHVDAPEDSANSKLVGEYDANLLRPDLVTAGVCTGTAGYCSFAIPIPNEFRNGTARPYFVKATNIDSQGNPSGTNPQLPVNTSNVSPALGGTNSNPSITIGTPKVGNKYRAGLQLPFFWNHKNVSSATVNIRSCETCPAIFRQDYTGLSEDGFSSGGLIPTTAAAGKYKMYVAVFNSANASATTISNEFEIVAYDSSVPYIRYDFNSDNRFDFADVALLGNLWKIGSACPAGKNCDVDGLQGFDIADAPRLHTIALDKYDLSGDRKVDDFDKNVVSAVFTGGSCLSAGGKSCDVNDDLRTDVSDGVIISWAVLSYSQLTTATPCDNTIKDKWCAYYFNDTTYTGLGTTAAHFQSRVHTQAENSVSYLPGGLGGLNYNWGTGGPSLPVPMKNDQYSVQWYGNFYFEAGEYQFDGVSDDGIRLNIIGTDGRQLLASFSDHGATPVNSKITFTNAGYRGVQVDYYENTGAAEAKVSWAKTVPTAVTPSVSATKQPLTENYITPPRSNLPLLSFNVSNSGSANISVTHLEFAPFSGTLPISKLSSLSIWQDGQQVSAYQIDLVNPKVQFVNPLVGGSYSFQLRGAIASDAPTSSLITKLSKIYLSNGSVVIVANVEDQINIVGPVVKSITSVTTDGYTPSGAQKAYYKSYPVYVNWTASDITKFNAQLFIRAGGSVVPDRVLATNIGGTSIPNGSSLPSNIGNGATAFVRVCEYTFFADCNNGTTYKDSLEFVVIDYLPATTNRPPIISGPQTISIAAGSTGSSGPYTVNDPDNNFASITVTGQSWTSMSVGGVGSYYVYIQAPATAGTYTATLVATDSQGLSGTLPLTITVNPVITLTDSVYVEAENGQVSPQMRRNTGVDGVTYASSPTAESGEAKMYFTVSKPGTYILHARVIAPDSNSDSFYVSLNGGTEDAFHTNDVRDANGNLLPYIPRPNWQWVKVTGEAGTGEPAKITRAFYLTAGQHYITFRTRNANTQLDKIFITSNQTAVPQP